MIQLGRRFCIIFSLSLVPHKNEKANKNVWNENQLMSLFYSYSAGSLHVSGPQAHLQENSYSCSHNHWFLMVQ